MTLAWLDSPLGLAMLFIVLLIVFGPQKVPEIAGQLGRALRELRRATGEFSKSMSLDDHTDTSYTPPRYDSYGTAYEPVTPHEDDQHPALSPAPAAGEAARGDFVASALSDGSTDYSGSAGPGAAPSNGSQTYGVTAEPQQITPRPPDATVPRA